MAFDSFMVGPNTSYDDNAVPTNWPMNNFGDPRVNVVGGQYLEWVRRGYVFSANIATAMSIPKYDATSNIPLLWNPSDSGKVVVPIKIAFSLEAAGTEVIHGLELIYKLNCGAAAATGAPIAAWTNIAPVCLLLGSSLPAATTKFSVANTPTAGVRLTTLGVGMWLENTTDTETPYQLSYEFNGTLMIKPGQAIGLCSNVASSSTYVASFIFAELPNFTF